MEIAILLFDRLTARHDEERFFLKDARDEVAVLVDEVKAHPRQTGDDNEGRKHRQQQSGPEKRHAASPQFPPRAAQSLNRLAMSEMFCPPASGFGKSCFATEPNTSSLAYCSGDCSTSLNISNACSFE